MIYLSISISQNILILDLNLIKESYLVTSNENYLDIYCLNFQKSLIKFFKSLILIL